MVAVIPEIVIRVHPGVDARQVHFLCESLALAIIKPMEFTTQEYLLQVLGLDAEAVFTALENLNKVEWIEWAAPNTASQPKLCGQLIPNDEYFPMQWHLHNTGQSGGIPGADIRAPEAWEIMTGDPNIIVAVLDTGVDSNHPDLVNNLVPGYDFLDNDTHPDPSLDHYMNAHGTACAGLIAAQGNNSIGVTGVTWNCKIMPIRIFRYRVDGTESWITASDIGTAFRWAATNGADIFSDSWVGYSSDQPIVHSAIVDVTQSGGIGRGGKGCIVFFAAGNSSSLMEGYPPKYPEVIAVGATDHNDMRCSYSNYGPELDIVAPGGDPVLPDYPALLWTLLLWTTDIHGPPGISSLPGNPWSDILDYTWFNGTSAATPVAAGVAALILSVEPNLAGDEVRHFLERSAKDLGISGRDDYYGWGRVDARAALDMVLDKRADLNNDYRVDFRDFAVLARCWKTDDLRGDIGPVPRPDGAVDIQDLALMGEYWLKKIPKIPEPGKARGPSPADGATNQPKSVLRWLAGETATAHNVYFGTDATAVENADTSSAEFLGKTTLPSSSAAVALQKPSTTYYWRIDEVEADGVTIYKGDIWIFTTAGLKAHSPSPADNALLVDPNAPLSWGQGFTARYHEVYLGTDRTAVENANTSSPLYKGRKTPPYTPGNLTNSAWYYWRVDEVESVQTNKHKGDVWQFKTIDTGVGL